MIMNGPIQNSLRSNVIIPESASIGTCIAAVSVQDLDEGDNQKIECYLQNKQFSIEPFTSGILELNFC